MPRPFATLPTGLDDNRARGPRWAAWLDELPAMASNLLEEWQLSIEGPAGHGRCALILPVNTAAGAPAVLKIGFPHPEAEHESLALRHWKGNGSVRLMRADPHRFALLLERLHTEDLTELGDVAACEVAAGIYRRLHVPALPELPQLTRLTSYVTARSDALAALPRQSALPRRLVEQAVAIGRMFASDPASDGTVIHGDLHYANVLAADREPWLVIGPKPMSGDPHYEPAPLLWNRWGEIMAGGHAREGIRRRFHTVVDVAGLDEDRARNWVVFRMICNASRGLDQPDLAGQPNPHDDATRCLTIAKAVQD